jgi:PAS domain S-box-containing protein
MTGRGAVLLLTIVVFACTVIFLGARVAQRMEALQAAPQDNVQWSLAQLDVELLALEVAAKDAQLSSAPDSPVLKNLRQRFDVFYSRVGTVESLPIFRDNHMPAEATEGLKAIKSSLKLLTQSIDLVDSAVQVRLPEISSQIDSLRAPVRQITLAGVKYYATDSDETRSELSRLLQQTAFVNTLLILAFGAALLFLVRQIRISRRHAAELESSSSRNASTVNASLDAIVVINMDGEVVEFNPAAVQTFGLSRNAALGAKLEDLIIPVRHRDAHRAGMERLRRMGEGKVIGSGRVEMQALRSDGSEFPIEMSLALSNSPGGRIVTAFLRDISQRVQQEADLRRARDEALEASRAKSQFLAMMSHEMRTPLNGIMALLDLLGASKLGSKQKSYVRTATASADILKQHVDDVLDLTRIQAGKLEFFPRVFDLVELLEEIQSLNLAMASKRGNSISLSVNMTEPYYVADRKRLHQVLTNLVGNAIKFTENGKISIAVRPLGVKADVVTLEFEVSDTGLGIAPDMQQAIFESFVTLDSFDQRNTTGAGLGLPICRSIVEGMGGEIGVESALMKGARFWFRVPMKVGFAEQARHTAGLHVPQEIRFKHDLKVLVVEDNDTNRFVARELLTSLGCTVTLADNGAEGVKAANKQCFDIIFMDISMPVMNGWEAAREIRNGAGASRGVQIVALTAHLLPDAHDLVRDSGINSIVVKPLRRDVLLNILREVASSNAAPGKNTLPEMQGHLRMVDDIQIAQMRKIFGEMGFKKKLAAFKVEVSDGITAMTAMSGAGNFVDLGRHAHRLAGSAAVFGCSQLHARLTEIEQMSRTKTSASANLEELADLLAASLQAMKALAPGGPSVSAEKRPARSPRTAKT